MLTRMRAQWGLTITEAKEYAAEAAVGVVGLDLLLAAKAGTRRLCFSHALPTLRSRTTFSSPSARESRVYADLI